MSFFCCTFAAEGRFGEDAPNSGQQGVNERGEEEDAERMA